jgi:hypothetical protein
MVAAAILKFVLILIVILSGKKYTGFKFHDSLSTGSKVAAVFEIFNLAGISASEGFLG